MLNGVRQRLEEIAVIPRADIKTGRMDFRVAFQSAGKIPARAAVANFEYLCSS